MIFCFGQIEDKSGLCLNFPKWNGLRIEISVAGKTIAVQVRYAKMITRERAGAGPTTSRSGPLSIQLVLTGGVLLPHLRRKASLVYPSMRCLSA